jgi:RimJ/RimL family protein N-acetyltransferase
MILPTRRLILRPFQESDYADVVAYATRPEFWRFLLVEPQTPETVKAFITRMSRSAMPDADGNCVFAIEVSAPGGRGRGRVIGSARIGIKDSVHRQGDLGWSLNPDFWGKGYASEAAAAVIAFGFERLGLQRIYATADVENTASQRVMARLGMRKEGEFRHHRLLRGAWRDSVVYGVVADEFCLRAAA